MPTIGGLYVSCFFTLIFYIAIGGIGISCSVSLGPPGPVYGGLYVSWFLDWYCIIYNVYIMPTIGGMYIVYKLFGVQGRGLYVSWCLQWYCIYYTKNWGVV